MKKNIIKIFIIVLSLTLINIVIYINKIVKPSIQNEKNLNEAKEIIVSQEERFKSIEIELEQSEYEKVKSLNEKERINIYLGRFINYLSEKNYEKAYNLLDNSFKQNYFKTIDEFIKYAKEKYGSVVAREDISIQRQGKYFIYTVNIIDFADNIKNFKQKFVIYETDYNLFTMSFQVN